MYKMVGADQKEYGPVTSEQVRGWIAQGRANPQTLVSFEGAPWKPLSSFPEFADALRTATPPPLVGYTGASPGVTRTSQLSVWGLVCSIIGMCGFCAPLAIIGVVCSIMGLVEINKSPHSFTTNRVLPIIGLVLGLVVLLGHIIFFMSGGLTRVMENFPE